MLLVTTAEILFWRLMEKKLVMGAIDAKKIINKKQIADRVIMRQLKSNQSLVTNDLLLELGRRVVKEDSR